MSTPIFFEGELQFRRYSDTSTQGQQVVFALPGRDELARFIGKEGKRFACVLVEIGDDEQPVRQPEPERPKGGALAKLAGMWCNDAAFVEWLRLTYRGTWTKAQIEHPDDAPDDWAAYVIRELCHITSRADLDNDPEAARRFQLAVRAPYMKHAGTGG